MEIKVDVPTYSSDTGITYKWEHGFEIETKIENGILMIVANKAGLISLANHLLNLAQNEIPIGHHLHFDDSNSLEENSVALIIQKS